MIEPRCLRRGQRGFACLAAAMVLVACAPMASQGVLPESAIASDWPVDAGGQAAAGRAAAALSWRDYFTDPQLVSLIETALRNNRDLRLALLRVEEARAAYGIQRAEQFPAIAVGAQGARSRMPGDLNGTGRALIVADYEAFVGMSSWELDLWGRVRGLKKAALQEYLATRAAQQAAGATLVAAVADGYLGLRTLDERLVLADQTIATREESLRIFRRRNEVGSASRLELTQVQTLLDQARLLQAQLLQARAVQAHALTMLLGAPVELIAVAGTRLHDENLLAPLRAGLPAELLATRPDIVAAERRLASAQANIGAARAAFFPRIALTGSLGSASAELDGLFESGSRAWTFVPTISLPIFDGGRRRASLDLAGVRRDMAIAAYERTIQVAFREVADALSSRQWLARQVGILRQSLETQTQRAHLAQLRYDHGAVAYLEVLEAQRDLLEAQQQWLQVRRSLLSSQIALYIALGGGTDLLSTSSSQTSVPVPSP